QRRRPTIRLMRSNTLIAGNLAGSARWHENWLSTPSLLVAYQLPTFWRDDANTLARPALRRANVAENAGFHFDCVVHARVGHRRQHSHLQRRQRRVAQAAAISRAGAIDSRLRAQPASTQIHDAARQFSRLPRPKLDAQRLGALHAAGFRAGAR